MSKNSLYNSYVFHHNKWVDFHPFPEVRAKARERERGWGNEFYLTTEFTSVKGHVKGKLLRGGVLPYKRLMGMCR